MTVRITRSLGWIVGLLGGALLFIAGLIGLVSGLSGGLGGKVAVGASGVGGAVVLLVIGIVALFFVRRAHGWWRGRPVSSGIFLLVIAVVGWILLGLGANLVTLAGAVLVFLSGVLFLVSPAVAGIKSLTS